MQIVFSIFNRIGYDLPNYKCAALAISNNGNIQTIYESPSLYMGHVVERCADRSIGRLLQILYVVHVVLIPAFFL